ncbi:hypothetical protein BCL90_4099 [Pedobacter alluvionis]|uniref:Uncharacterized protein n=1 Tax=Pedobacter alluvionis TaxID=475253 RepID=A0A497XY54_9SPHI|nr:hypothetical protein BCL90_4099 [Pedobacter alluvionis]
MKFFEALKSFNSLRAFIFKSQSVIRDYQLFQLEILDVYLA